MPFVQANLIDAGSDDDPAMVERWREALRDAWRLGQRAGAAVPLSRLARLPAALGLPDDEAWERALDHYLTHHVDFSDIQDQRPRRLHELELATVGQR